MVSSNCYNSINLLEKIVENCTSIRIRLFDQKNQKLGKSAWETFPSVRGPHDLLSFQYIVHRPENYVLWFIKKKLFNNWKLRILNFFLYRILYFISIEFREMNGLNGITTDMKPKKLACVMPCACKGILGVQSDKDSSIKHGHCWACENKKGVAGFSAQEWFKKCWFAKM